MPFQLHKKQPLQIFMYNLKYNMIYMKKYLQIVIKKKEEGVEKDEVVLVKYFYLSLILNYINQGKGLMKDNFQL